MPGVGTCQRNTSASFLNNRYAITSAHNVTDLLQYNPTYEVADGTSVVEATPRRFYDTLAWADRIRA